VPITTYSHLPPDPLPSSSSPGSSSGLTTEFDGGPAPEDCHRSSDVPAILADFEPVLVLVAEGCCCCPTIPVWRGRAFGKLVDEERLSSDREGNYSGKQNKIHKSPVAVHALSVLTWINSRAITKSDSSFTALSALMVGKLCGEYPASRSCP